MSWDGVECAKAQGLGQKHPNKVVENELERQSARAPEPEETNGGGGYPTTQQGYSTTTTTGLPYFFFFL